MRAYSSPWARRSVAATIISPIFPKNAPARAALAPPQPAMEDAIDLDAAAGLASLASSGAVAPSRKGKPRAPRKTAAATKPKKALTPEQWAMESAKRKGRRHAADARDEAAAVAAAHDE